MSLNLDIVLLLTVVLYSAPCEGIVGGGHVWPSTKSDTYRIFSDQDISKEKNIIHVEGRSSFSFKVRACSDAHIFLRDTATTNTGYKATHIWLGKNGNTQSSIGPPIKEPYVTVNSTNLLHCSELRQFWISWNTTHVNMGRGPSYGFQGIMSAAWPQRDRHRVLSATLSTGPTFTGTWELDDDIGRGVTITTPASERYSYFWATVENGPPSFSFTVQSDDDVSVALGSSIGDVFYQIHFGISSGNTSIQVGDRIVKTVHMNLGDYSRHAGSLYVHWHMGGVIYAGTGLLGNKNSRGAIIYADVGEEAYHPVSALGFGSSAVATWDMHSDIDQFYSFKTSSEDVGNYTHAWLRAPIALGTTFFAETCDQSIRLILAKDTNTSSASDVTIIVGNNDDNETSYVTIGDETSKPIPGQLLFCDVLRLFWIRWAGDKVAIGQGLTSDMTPLLETTVRGVSKLGLLGFTSTNASSVSWAIHPLKTDEVIFISDSTHAVMPMIPTPGLSRRFSLQANGQAGLKVVGSDYIIDMSIPMDMHNPKTVKIQMTHGYDVVEMICNHTYDVVSSSRVMDYWVSWIDGYFTYGIDQDIRDPADYECHPDTKIVMPSLAINVYADSTESATWAFPAEKEDDLIFTTPSLEQTWRWIKLKSLKMLNKNDDELNGKENKAYTSIVFAFKGTKGMSLFLNRNYTSRENVIPMTHGLVIKLDDMGAFAIRGPTNELLESTRSVADVLSEHKKVWFWIQQRDQKLVMGHGHLGDNVIGEYTLPAAEYAYDGQWKSIGVKNTMGTEVWIPAYIGSELRLTTATTPNGNQVTHEVMTREHLVFGIKGCKSLSEIYLYPNEIHGHSSDMLRITIERRPNQYISVKLKKGSNIVATGTGDMVLNCEDELAFWMLFTRSGEIAVGQHTGIYEDIIMNWYNLDPYPVHSLGFSNGYNKASGDWRIHLGTGKLFDTSDWIDHHNFDNSAAGLSGGAIAGIVIAVTLVVAIIAVAVLFVMRGVPEPIERTWNSMRARTSTDTQRLA